MPGTEDAPAPLGVIGGSGLYSLLDADVEEILVETPYGDPSDVLVRGRVDGAPVVFLPRHGRGHRHPPHRINYRANLWALRYLGVRQVIAPCAVGSLRPESGPGAFVLPHQVVDRTSGRVGTYFDTGAVHVPFADPYCPGLRETLLKSAATLDLPVVDGGTTVVIDGPRFASRAESQWYAAQGWSLINMTAQPEATLARELALCYQPVALVTDHDAGTAPGESVTQTEVFRIFADNLTHLRALILTAAPTATTRTREDCPCPDTHHGITLPLTLP
ncbi:S-methyl-5'-thioadenosine phosphorylase [Actinokineospora auranticolor]|uniref:Purine nucleoside phosphorylase n=1 Tax=Actinokineospora auranticolor TaxID=155976 RepID=A0A2S6GDI8_9PSEU|nr:S-methyl-5'-thioadenosine phosphorylase [Actinokineospora auranticolor]PPK63156.1 5'-methylthioadenosine phosphorylase [Actinokineospora auranticolor]